MNSSLSQHRIDRWFTFSIRSLSVAIGLAAICLGALVWSLGQIDLAVAASAKPATSFAFMIDTLADGNDVLHSDGLCATGGGECTLRAAFEEIYSWPAISTIATVSFGVTGTLIGAMGDVYADVTVIGPAGGITLTGDTDGNGAPNISIMNVQPGATVHLQNLTLTKATGAIANNGTLYITDVVFFNNSGGVWGGALYNENGMTQVANSAFISNSSIATGGAIRNGSAILYLSDSTFANNSSNYGGAIYHYRGDVIISDVTFSGNYADQDGGAIYNEGLSNFMGFITATNSTFSGNTANDQGGGIYQGAGVLDFKHVTFSGNTAANSGGGIYISGNSPFTLSNSIVANSAANDCVENFGGTLIDNGGNLMEDGSCGFSIGGDPALGPLQDNGGSMWTHALGASSPAIDAGDPASCSPIDQRGETRDDLNCDSGAYELRLAESGTITKTNVMTGTYTFGPTLIKLNVTTLGTLSDLGVQRIDADHPQRTGTSSDVGAGWGRYWTFTPNAGASGFAVDMVLPAAFTLDANDKVCRYTGVDRVWDCDVSGFDSNWITRTAVDHFSDWAVGNNVSLSTSGPRYVSDVNGSDTTDCATPSSPCKTIGYALTQAVVGDEILVAEGTYTENLTIGSPQTVTLRGGYESIGWTRDIAAHVSIINGNGVDAPVIRIQPDRNVIIEGFTVRGGAHTSDNGGGFFINDATVVISGTTVRDNTTAWDGGGINIEGSNPTVTVINSALISNTAARSGGGLRNWFSTNTVLDNVLVQGNVAQGTSGGAGGGGIMANVIAISNSQILSNTAFNEGGGASGNRLTLFNSIVSYNTVSQTTFSVDGGGLLVRSGSLDLKQSRVSYNRIITGGFNSGSGVVAGNSKVTIDRSSFIGNQAPTSVLVLYSSPFTLTNILVADNSSAGIRSDEVPLTGTMWNATIAGNAGMGVNISCGNVHVTNSVLWGNNASDLNCHDASNLTLAYSDVGTGITSGTSNLSIDPKFIGADNYHLKVGSPVIDKGTLSGAPTIDLDGALRFGKPDMGAYEWIGFRLYLPLVLKNY